ncbi:uncharacterized protein [Leptinotarsa decemlineata]|uniref:uncharacterized protein n=1 Tax=Leptinotarsa decemlineata TaxID=7539 RepID=UPI003D30CF7A
MSDENADSQTDKIEGATEEVQVDKAPTAEKGTSERFVINKVQIRPGKPLIGGREDVIPNFSTRLPVLESKAAPYVPMPYIFRVPLPPVPTKIKNLRARSPPFYLLLDHAISVIWLIFAEKEYECPLGIAQLQWASAFLKTIHNRQGEHPKDVEVCIDAIEEILLNQYAELSKEMNTANKLDESVHYVDGALGTSNMVSKNIPFSLNYSEMVKRCPQIIEAQVHGAVSMTSAEATAELDNIKKAAGKESLEELDTVSKNKAINVLKMWKTDQMEKIRGELRRLRSIEDKMKDIDSQYTEEDDADLLFHVD